MKESESILKLHFNDPQNTGMLKTYNCQGKDSSLSSGATVIFYGLLKDGVIKDISFRAFGCSYLIAASSLITTLAEKKDLLDAAKISLNDIEKKHNTMADNKKDSLNVAIGAFYNMLSSYMPELVKNKSFQEEDKKVAVAMSGGIDSSMAAKILKDKGFDCIGITMKIVPDDALPSNKRITSWMDSNIQSARMVCDILDMPHLVIDLSESFEEKIIGPFCNEYLKGKTPNPCIECNKLIKFGLLLQNCCSLGARYMATGHYCRIEKDADTGAFQVKKGIDPLKDQSYVFWKLSQSQLMHMKTPIGAFTKEQIKKESRDFLSFLEKKEESQDICFISEDRYQDFLSKRIGKIKKGKIFNTEGQYLGEHRGFPYYTIGQRKGLGISHSGPLYVKQIIPEDNQIIVGEMKELIQNRAYLEEVNFISPKPPNEEFIADIKIRYSSPGAEAKVTLKENSKAIAYFKKDVSSVTPGQSAVFYDGDILLGGGIITG